MIFYLIESGQVFTMGKNNYGQAGFSSEEKKIGEPRFLFTDKNIISLSAGYEHSFCLSSKSENTFFFLIFTNYF